MKPGSSRFPAYALYALAVAIGGGGLVAFSSFLYLGSFGRVRFDGSEGMRLVWDGGLCLVFFLQHSGMVRASFRRRLERRVRAEFHGAVYAIASGAVLLLLVLLWQESAHTLATAEGAWRWLLRSVFLAALGGMAWGLSALGSFDTLGLESISRHVRDRQPPTKVSFTVRGPYRWVRHPLYFFALVLIWSCPDLTADRLLFDLLWTAWIVAGTWLEERDLVAAFGEPYRDYRRRVPMLIPYRLRPARPC